jgi:hypothetical protein
MRHFDLVDFESGRGEKRRPPRGVENTVVLARLFNEVQAQKMPSRMVRLILSEYLASQKLNSLTALDSDF